MDTDGVTEWGVVRDAERDVGRKERLHAMELLRTTGCVYHWTPVTGTVCCKTIDEFDAVVAKRPSVKRPHTN